MKSLHADLFRTVTRGSPPHFLRNVALQFNKKQKWYRFSYLIMTQVSVKNAAFRGIWLFFCSLPLNCPSILSYVPMHTSGVYRQNKIPLPEHPGAAAFWRGGIAWCVFTKRTKCWAWIKFNEINTQVHLEVASIFFFFFAKTLLPGGRAFRRAEQTPCEHGTLKWRSPLNN